MAKTSAADAVKEDIVRATFTVKALSPMMNGLESLPALLSWHSAASRKQPILSMAVPILLDLGPLNAADAIQVSGFKIYIGCSVFQTELKKPALTLT
ncbi:MAG: hypothetical protein FWG10_05555 [Eubacteriaceae bacterium]|nr:hypothetical protein [Eubacteriaceae bacterium]